MLITHSQVHQIMVLIKLKTIIFKNLSNNNKMVNFLKQIFSKIRDLLSYLIKISILKIKMKKTNKISL